MKKLYLSYGTIVSPIGIGVQAHLDGLKAGHSGVARHEKSGFNGETWFLGKINSLAGNRYNHLLEIALSDLQKNIEQEILENPKTLIIISTTKANLEALPNDTFESTREIIKETTKNPNAPIIISNACISGVLAVNTAADYLQTDTFDDAIIIGIDALFDFVVFGFQSLYALSDEPCKPFDKDRKGISIGEACGILHLSKSKNSDFSVAYLGGACSNDANHISGPSRTGEGLVRAIEKSLLRANIQKEEIDFISAHGTGTLYNDEMESIAFGRLDLARIPVNSMKGYFGHTLGAAGVIELIMCLISMENDILFESKGFENQGTSEKINMIGETSKSAVNTVLKTASGFGGGNAAIIIQKVS